MCYLSRSHQNMYFLFLLRKCHLIAKPQMQHPKWKERFLRYGREKTEIQKPLCSRQLATASETVRG